PLISKITQQVDLLGECEENLKEAESFAKAGHWVWNIAKKELYWSDEIFRIFGCRPNEYEESFDGLLSFVHPNDRKMLNTAVEGLLKHNDPYNIEHRIVSQNGEEKIVQERGKVTRDAHGKPIRLFGTVSNITQIKQKEKMLTDLNKAYSRFVPLGLLKLLGKPDIKHVNLGDQVEKNMPILFSDIRNFTTISEQMSPEETFSFINSYLAMMEPIILSHHGIIDKYMGDAIMVLFPMGIESAIHCAVAMQAELSVYNQENIKQGLPLVKIGIGINSGKMTLGIVGGLHRMDSTVISDAVNLASRIEGLTKVYRSPLLISDSVYFSLSKIENLDVRFVDRVVAKGRSVPVSVYEVFSSDLPDIQEKKRKTRNIFEEALCLYHFKRISESQKLLEQCLKINSDDNIAQIYLQRCKDFKVSQVHQGVDDIGHIPQWDDSLLIHVSQIDQQHKELFRRIGLLVEAVIQRKGSEQVVETLSFLEKHTQKHFKDEEELMMQNEYPHYLRHKEAHTNFIESLNLLKKERNYLGSDSLHLLLRIHSQVINWLMTHIKYTDTKLAKFLKENGVAMD
ncbi:MAG: bacteriohemerythrin, partial [Methylococcales bacterium]|nr:bacteriohemerythrin [Methylococcales bacterium]